MGKNKNSATMLALPCGFGNLNVGDKTCRLGVRVDRSRLTLTKANEYLCGRRLTIKLMVEAGSGETPAIPALSSSLDLVGTFDCKSFGVTTKSLTFGLTGSIPDLDLEILTKFAKRDGHLSIAEVADLPEDEQGDDE